MLLYINHNCVCINITYISVMHVCIHLVCNAMNASEMCLGWFLFVSSVKPRQPWTCSGRTPWPPRRRRRKRSSTRILQMEGGAGWWCCTASWYVHLKLNSKRQIFVSNNARLLQLLLVVFSTAVIIVCNYVVSAFSFSPLCLFYRAHRFTKTRIKPNTFK